VGSGIYYPAVSGDDGFWYDSSFNSSLTQLPMGESGTSYNVFIRFANVTIPPGVEILTAIVKITAGTSNSVEAINIRISGNDIDSATAPTSASQANGLVLTTAYADWDDISAWTASTQYDSVDFAAVVQEIIDRGGWGSGNALQIVLKDNNSDSNAYRQGTAEDYAGGSYKVELHVTWIDPPSIVTLPEPFVAIGLLNSSMQINILQNTFITTNSILEPTISVVSLINAYRVYTLTLTGASDGEDDIIIPISSFQCRIKNDEPTYLSVVIPGIDYLSSINARLNGNLILRLGYKEGSEILISEIVANVLFENIRYDEGATNKSITLDGHITETWFPKAITLNGVSYKNLNNGLLRVRAKPNLYLRPGDTVTADGEIFEVSSISFSVATNQETYEVAE